MAQPEWPASRHRIASLFASSDRIAEDFRSDNTHRQDFCIASHRRFVFSTHRRSHRIAPRIARYGPLRAQPTSTNQDSTLGLVKHNQIVCSMPVVEPHHEKSVSCFCKRCPADMHNQYFWEQARFADKPEPQPGNRDSSSRTVFKLHKSKLRSLTFC